MRHQDQWNKQGHHEISGNGSHEIKAYRLSHTDQDQERRNFPGYSQHTPGESYMKDISQEGHTESRGGTGMHGSHSKTHAGASIPRRYQ